MKLETSITDINSFTPELARRFNCTFDKQLTGSFEWKRIFVLKGDRISIGRMSFQNGELYSFKFYKPTDYPLAEEDKIMIRLEHYCNTGVFISSKRYDELVEIAKVKKEEDIAQKYAWRKDNPPKEKTKMVDGYKTVSTIKRKKIFGKSVRFILCDLIREEFLN